MNTSIDTELVDDSSEMRCARHPNTPTRLRCGRCDTPICTRCAVRTPVGLRCADCARVRPPVQYQTDATIVVRGLAVALGVGLVIGIAWGLLNRAGLGARSPYDWGFWFGLLLGFGVAESLSLAAKRKRGPLLQAIGIAAVLTGFLASRVVLSLRGGRGVAFDQWLSQPLTIANGLSISLVTVLVVALACVIVWVRFR